MGGSKSGRTKVSQIIRASREVLYRAFLDPDALVSWLPPGGMTGKMHHFDARVGGTYVMSLYYPPDEGIHRGKTAAREDRITVCFVELSPPARIIEEVFFHSEDPALAGSMVLEVGFATRHDGTEVSLVCTEIPPGIRPEDNAEGSRLSLENLSRYVAGTEGISSGSEIDARGCPKTDTLLLDLALKDRLG